MSEAKVGTLSGEITSSGVPEYFVYLGNMYLGKDLKTYHSMDICGRGDGGTYFETEKEAQALADKYNGVFRIEEGKYYKTHDGRKVGPMYDWDNKREVFGSSEIGMGGLWNKDGSAHFKGAKDSPLLVSEWVEEPKLWKDMTPEEKGALLLAHHEGKVIEAGVECGWRQIAKPSWADFLSYRIKPEPTVKTVTLYGRADTDGDWSFGTGEAWPYDSHKITLTFTDGEVSETAKVEKL